LEIGDNKILINVVAEDGSSRTYSLIITRQDPNRVILSTKEDIIAAINSSDDKIIEVQLNVTDQNKIIDKDIIEALIGKDKAIIFTVNDNSGGTLYSTEINGENVSNSNANLNLNLSFISPVQNDIEKLSNKKDALYLSFEDHEKLPAKVQMKLFVGNKYEDNESLFLYYYNQDKNRIEFIKDNIVVKNGYVEFDLAHHSDYLLTPDFVEIAKGNPGGSILPLVIIIAMIGAISGLAIYVFVPKKRL
jgi:hypothetical protein